MMMEMYKITLLYFITFRYIELNLNLYFVRSNSAERKSDRKPFNSQILHVRSYLDIALTLLSCTVIKIKYWDIQFCSFYLKWLISGNTTVRFFFSFSTFDYWVLIIVYTKCPSFWRRLKYHHATIKKNLQQFVFPEIGHYKSGTKTFQFEHLLFYNNTPKVAYVCILFCIMSLLFYSLLVVVIYINSFEFDDHYEVSKTCS